MEIRVHSLTLSYRGRGVRELRRRPRPAVRDLSFAAAPGEVVALVGENGSGKTTTLRLVAGLLSPDSGEALLGGVPAIRPEARRCLGYVPEEDGFPAGLPIRDVLRFAAALAGQRGPAARAGVEAAARAFGLAGRLGEVAERSSRGVRRRVSLAQALVGAPTALVMDEPFTGLDPVARAEAVTAIRRAAARGAAVVVSLHDAAVIRELADRLVALAGGVQIAAGRVGDLAGGPTGDAAASRRGAGAADEWLVRLLQGPSSGPPTPAASGSS